MGPPRRLSGVARLLAGNCGCVVRGSASTDLRELRRGRGWTIEELAVNAELSYRTVQAAESGEHTPHCPTRRAEPRWRSGTASGVKWLGKRPHEGSPTGYVHQNRVVHNARPNLHR